MAYNNIFPMGYQYYPTQPNAYPNAYPTQVTQSNATQPNSNLIWVQGEAGAKSYLVAPNSTVQLWDSEKQTIYLKSADASGMPSMKTLDYTIRDLSPAKAPESGFMSDTNYATKADLKTLYGRLEALEMAIKPNNRSEALNNEQSPVRNDE